MAFDPVAALATLQRHGVQFVVIGGVAGRLWGSPTMTNDVDICYDRDPANLERLAAALRELHAGLRGVEDDVPLQLDATTLANGQNFTFTTSLGPLDILGLPAGIRDFKELAVNATSFDLGDGVIVKVCDLDDLIRMKRASGRPKDRIEVEVLSAVSEERDRSAHRAKST
jgi:predicted nucleotidyltransferase